jgi:hypothetical protein
MRGRTAAVDDAHVMTSTAHLASADQLERLLAIAAGRSGSHPHTIACPDPERAPTRPKAVMRMRTRISTGQYVADPHAVAAAIVECVFATERTNAAQARAA